MSERKPDEQRIRRNAPEIPWTDLPAEGRHGRAPALPKWAALDATGKAWWAWAWKLPEATQWHEAQLPSVVRRAHLEGLWQSTEDVRLLAEIRQLETILGMTPKARRELRWRIVDGDEIVEENGRKVPDDLAERRARIQAKRAAS